MQVLALGFIKLSVLFFYRRIFCTIGGGVFDCVNKILLGVTAAWTLTFFFTHLFSCGKEITALWGPLKDTIRFCKNTLSMENGFGISDFVLDFLVLILPIPKVIESCRLSRVCYAFGS